MTQNAKDDLPDISLEALRLADKVFKEFRERDEMLKQVKAKFPVWKTILIKDYRSSHEVNMLRGNSGISVARMGISTDDFLEAQLNVPPEIFGKIVFLVATSYSDLEIDKDATVAQIYARAKEFSLVPCPRSSAICFALQIRDYKAAPSDRSHVFFTERFEFLGSDSVPTLFNGILYNLYAYDARVLESPDSSLIFALPYK